jgi:hypothetical protein
MEPIEQNSMVSLEYVMHNGATSYWLKNALSSALERDPIDSANDAELLAQLLSAHCASVLQKALFEFSTIKTAYLITGEERQRLISGTDNEETLHWLRALDPIRKIEGNRLLNETLPLYRHYINDFGQEGYRVDNLCKQCLRVFFGLKTGTNCMACEISKDMTSTTNTACGEKPCNAMGVSMPAEKQWGAVNNPGEGDQAVVADFASQAKANRFVHENPGTYLMKRRADGSLTAEF